MITIRKYSDEDYMRASNNHETACREELSMASLSEVFISFEIASIDEGFFEYDTAVALLDNCVVGFTA